MNGFSIVMDGKECACTKCDKVYVELDNSNTRSEVDCTELKSLIESFNIPIEPISGTICIIKNGSPDYDRVNELFEKLREECIKKGE